MRSPLAIQNRSNAAADYVRWIFRGQASSPVQDFGYPTTATDYVFCLFSEAGPPSLVFRAVAPSDGLCLGEACWKTPGPFSVHYLDRERTPDGIKRALLKAPGARLTLKMNADGPNLSGRPFGLPALPLALPLRVQLQAEDGACWEETYSTTTSNTATLFRASSD